MFCIAIKAWAGREVNICFFLAMASSGCDSGTLFGHGEIYAAINDALISQGSCENLGDCQKRELVFWESSNNRMYFNIYGSDNLDQWRGIEIAVVKARRNTKITAVIELSFFKETKAQALRADVYPAPVYTKVIK